MSIIFIAVMAAIICGVIAIKSDVLEYCLGMTAGVVAIIAAILA